MGRETKNFRQTGKAGNAQAGIQAYTKMNRQGPYGNTTNKNMNIKQLNKKEGKIDGQS